jgi:uncharacterized protein DUF4339/uncharacterized protein DUF4234
MNYFIKRDLSEYGPYSLADLQKYVASGNVLLTDLCRSEGLTDWVPVSQVIGNIPVPASAPQPAAGTVYGGAPAYAAPTASPYPPPPNLHWGIFVLLGVLTCGIFGWVWAFVQAAWVKKVEPESKALIYYGISVGLFVLMFVAAFSEGAAGRPGAGSGPLFLLGRLGGGIMWLVAAFNLRSSIENHFSSKEPIGLSLNGVMTFFFSVYYFQYHFTKINEMKQRQMMGHPG